jgi:predicted DNA-binding transcriptional regulator YafY
MARSTHAGRAQRLNAAFDLIASGYSLNEAAEALVEQFELSRRQAYRYLQEAQSIKRPVQVCEPTIPITIKVPGDVVVKLRAYAQVSGLTIGETVARAVLRFLAKASRHG